MKKFFGEFKEFAVKGNVIDLAVGIIIGAAFNKIVSSLVTDIILPPIGLILNRVDFANLFISLNRVKYASIAEAQAAHAPTLNYGIFIDNIISFLITAFAVFLIIKQINRFKRRQETGSNVEASTKPCPFCYSVIPIKASRCPQCTSQL